MDPAAATCSWLLPQHQRKLRRGKWQRVASGSERRRVSSARLVEKIVDCENAAAVLVGTVLAARTWREGGREKTGKVCPRFSTSPIVAMRGNRQN